jgi:TonB-dependent receptor
VRPTPTLPLRRTSASCAVSAAVLAMAASCAHAQQPAPAPARANGAGEIQQVLVVGTRAAERSSNDRKKNAATAQDSIIADDVGSFPDRNVAEAISRVAGVSLERNEFGEGNTISVRGNGPEFTRVEIDGLGALSGGGTDLNGGGDGRGITLSEMPAELISSVDIVKGATAEMTEGSLGGTILIKTRTGLDFKKRTIVARAGAEQNTLGKKWTPSFHVTFADKFLDQRLGIVANVTKSDARSESHSVSQNGGSTGGPLRTIDFDNSPEKTFTWNPNTLATNDPAATSPLASWARNAASGGGRFNSLSPQEILSRSAEADTKDECYAAFPFLSNADLTGLSGSDANRARNQRINELRTCLGQWNDYAPWLVRNRVRRQQDERLNTDIRADFKINNNLTVYAKYGRQERTLTDETLNLTLGDMAFNGAGTFTDSAVANNRTTRTPVAGSNYYFFDTPTNAGSSSTFRGLTNGQVANVLPGSVQVDENHYVTRFTLADGSTNTDQALNKLETNSRTGLFGGTWRSGGLRAEFLAGRTTSDFYRYGWRTNFASTYGPVDVALAPNGLWTHTPQNTGFDQGDPGNYDRLVPGAANQPLRTRGTNGTQLTLENPKTRESREDVLKIDLSYALSNHLPFFNTLKAGINRRKQSDTTWGAGGLQVSTSPSVWTPDLAVRSFFYGCQDTPGSAGTANACKYGINPAPTALSNPRDSRDVHVVLTPAEYSAIVNAALNKQTANFFGGAKDRPSTLVDSWTEIDIAKVWELTKVPHMNPLDCLKECTASDGKVYAQPITEISEKVSAGYLQSDFTIDRLPFTAVALPWGMELEGNFGWRYVKTDVSGTSATTFEATTIAANGAETTTAVRRNSTLNASTTDIMPIFNLAWWAVPDQVVVRYNRAKQIARPAANRLTGDAVVCRNIVSELPDDDDDLGDLSCRGTLGNPSLRPFTNVNHNLSVEWYPNSDTVFGVSVFRNKGRIGAPRRVAVLGARPFAGTGETDPLGQPLDDITFNYTTWENGPALDKRGVELTAKTAFSFLPSVLKYTGITANYTRLRADSLEGQIVDVYTGTPLDPVGQQRYSWNAALWYDDGALQMRVATQVTTASLRRLASDDSFENLPAVGMSIGGLPFNAGQPVFKDAIRFVDAKVSYKFKNGIQVFAEGRNLGKRVSTNSQGQFGNYADGTPSIVDYTYSGARYMVGVVLSM